MVGLPQQGPNKIRWILETCVPLLCPPRHFSEQGLGRWICRVWLSPHWMSLTLGGPRAMTESNRLMCCGPWSQDPLLDSAFPLFLGLLGLLTLLGNSGGGLATQSDRCRWRAEAVCCPNTANPHLEAPFSVALVGTGMKTLL